MTEGHHGPRCSIRPEPRVRGLLLAISGSQVHVATTVSYRVAGGGHPPPAPTERSVRISRTTLFGEGFTAQRMPGTAGMAEPSVVAVAHYELSLLFVRILLS